MKINLVGATVMAAATLCAAQQNSEASKAAAAKAAPSVTYIKAGKLFDSTSDSYRENVVIVVEGERIKAVEPATFHANPQRSEGDRLVERDRPARADRLPYTPGRARRPVQPHQRLQEHALYASFRCREKRTDYSDWPASRPCATSARVRSWLLICATTSTRDTSSVLAWWPAGREFLSRAATAT